MLHYATQSHSASPIAYVGISREDQAVIGQVVYFHCNLPAPHPVGLTISIRHLQHPLCNVSIFSACKAMSQLHAQDLSPRTAQVVRLLRGSGLMLTTGP